MTYIPTTHHPHPPHTPPNHPHAHVHIQTYLPTLVDRPTPTYLSASDLQRKYGLTHLPYQPISLPIHVLVHPQAYTYIHTYMRTPHIDPPRWLHTYMPACTYLPIGLCTDLPTHPPVRRYACPNTYPPFHPPTYRRPPTYMHYDMPIDLHTHSPIYRHNYIVVVAMQHFEPSAMR